jgi:CBS domain-containing protein
MARFVRDLMTSDPFTLERDATAVDAARVMKEHDVGSVVVTDGGQACGIITDRDIVIRGIAEGRSPDEIKVGEACTSELAALAPDDSIDDAIRQIRERHVRRLPVVEEGRPVGILSIGDLALERDKESALAEISAAAPDH